MQGNVLALSGGGFRGLYTIRILRNLEKHIGRPLGEHFNLITGTSIGGIIALGIAAGISLDTIEETFISRGKHIFPKPIVRRDSRLPMPLQRLGGLYRKFRAIFRPIHDAKGLHDVLTDLFGDMEVQHLKKANVAITSANLSTGSPKMFKTPHHGEIYLDKHLKVVDVALATSAAPVYFPIHEIPQLNTLYADGALMGNAPGFFGWLEAKTRLGIPENEIFVLSVGTLAGKPSLSGSTKYAQGALFWLSPEKLRLMRFLMSQQEQLTNYMLRLLLKDRYHLIDGSVSDDAANDIDLDDTSDAAIKTLISHAEKHFADFTSTAFCQTHFPREVSHNA